jgi:hypothetical protein
MQETNSWNLHRGQGNQQLRALRNCITAHNSNVTIRNPELCGIFCENNNSDNTKHQCLIFPAPSPWVQQHSVLPESCLELKDWIILASRRIISLIYVYPYNNWKDCRLKTKEKLLKGKPTNVKSSPIQLSSHYCQKVLRILDKTKETKNFFTMCNVRL